MLQEMPRLDVMISSTSRDLLKQREVAAKAAQKSGYFAVQMEDLGAKTGEDAISISLKMVDEADVYIGIFGTRYGFIPDAARNPEKVSITEMEYRKAKKSGMPILIFLMDDEHPAAKDSSLETDTEAREKLKQLKDELKTNHIVGFFKSDNELANLIILALKDDKLKADALGYHQKRPVSTRKSEAKKMKFMDMVAIVGTVAGVIATVFAALTFYFPQQSNSGNANQNQDTGIVTQSPNNPNPSSNPTHSNQIQANSALITAEQTGECFGRYAVPILNVMIVVAETSTLFPSTLYPVPSNSASDIENNALHPQIPRDYLLGVIARSSENGLNWLYVEYRRENQATRYGFILLEQSSYSQNYSALPVIDVPICDN